MQTIQEAKHSDQPHGNHVLLMEDELTIATGLARVMSKEGYDVDMAHTGRDALEKFWANGFDLLVADLRLPDIDGMDVVREVRKKRPKMTVVIITGYPSVSSATTAVQMGVSGYLSKPFTGPEFMATVRSALREKEKESIEQLIIKTQKERLVQREEVIRVLERASQDQEFWRGLMENGSEVLKEYRLSGIVKAAIVSGDLDWIKKNIVDVTKEQLMFINKRLEREAW